MQDTYALRDLLDAEGMVLLHGFAQSEAVPDDALLLAMAMRSRNPSTGRQQNEWKIYAMPRDVVMHAIGGALTYEEQLLLWAAPPPGRVLVLVVDADGRTAFGTLPTGEGTPRQGGSIRGRADTRSEAGRS